MKSLKSLLFGIGTLIALSGCPEPVPVRSSADISYRAEVIEGSMNISLSIYYGTIDQEGDWIHNDYAASNGADISRMVNTPVGRSVRLSVSGQSNNPAKVRIRIKDDGNTVESKDITATNLGSPTYQVSGSIEYDIPQ